MYTGYESFIRYTLCRRVPLIGLSFHSPEVSLEEQKFLILIQFSLSICFLWIILLMLVSKKSYCQPSDQRHPQVNVDSCTFSVS